MEFTVFQLTTDVNCVREIVYIKRLFSALIDATVSDSSDANKGDSSVTSATVVAADEGTKEAQHRSSSRSPEVQPDSTSPNLSPVPAEGGDDNEGSSQTSSSSLDASTSKSSPTSQLHSSPKSSNADAQVSRYALLLQNSSLIGREKKFLESACQTTLPKFCDNMLTLFILYISF